MNIEGNKEQFILNIIDASVDGILAFDLECRYTVWNSTMESISGISREQAIGSYAFDLFPFLKETGEDQFFFQALSGQKVRSKDRVYKIPETDREGLFNAYYAPSYNEEGKIIGGIGIIRDITDRRRAEEALGISELRFRSMIEQSPLSVQIFSPDGTTIQVNRAWEELWGVRLEQIQGYNILKDKQLVTAGIMPYIEKAFNGEATSIPAILYNPEDTIPNITKHKDPKRWVQAYIYPVKDDQGTIKEVVLMHEDITEQKYAEETAKESTNRLTFTLEASQIGDWSWNAVTDVVTFSERAAEIFGIPPGPYMTWTQMQELLHKEDREKVRMAVNTVVTNREYYDIEYRVVRPNDGRECWVWAKGKPTYNSKDELLGMTGIVQDITNRKLTEERIKTYNSGHT
jgi:PAS domain S-box-containing protein